MIQPVILCGGSGTRLWPLSRKSFPKQFVPLIGGKSLLQLTLERVLPLAGGAADGIICVAGEEHRFLIAEAVEALGAKGSAIDPQYEPASPRYRASGLGHPSVLLALSQQNALMEANCTVAHIVAHMLY